MADQDNSAPTEREKWEADQRARLEELALKRRELDLREKEARRARWWNPLVLAVFTAALAGLFNIAANFYSSREQRVADAEKAIQTERLESEKAEANLILEVVKTGNPDRAAEKMRVPKVITDPADIMLATRAAVRMAGDFRFNHIVMPGMGTGCGQMLPGVAARAMRAGIEAALRDIPHRPFSWQEAQERHFQLKG
jgi:hypothetical protein